MNPPSYFIPLITLSMLIFGIGVYLNIARKITGFLFAWKTIIDFRKFNAHAFWRAFFRDVVFLEWLKKENKVRWLRHLLLYWGFLALWLFDIAFAIAAKFLPDNNRFILFLHAGLDLSGLVLLSGTLFAMLRFLLVRKTSDRVFSYLFEVTLLFLVTISGFALEIMHILSVPEKNSYSSHLIGYSVALLIEPLKLPWGNLLPAAMFIHLIFVAGFFAFIPFSRLAHIIATPIGRLLNSQDLILREKRRAIVSGLLNDMED